MRYVLTAGAALERGEELPLSAAGASRVFELAAGVIPDIHAAPLPPEAHPLSGLPYRLIKSHNVREVSDHIVVYLFRRPEDSLLSYAHYAGRAGAGADRFVLRQVRTWAAEAEFALSCHRKDPARFFLMSYEQMLEQTSRSVAEIADWLGMQIDPVHRQHAIALNDFRRLKSAEGRDRHAGVAAGGSFFRRGAAGAGGAELEKKTLAAVDVYARPTYEQLLDASRGE
jgi:hypothetical protein